MRAAYSPLGRGMLTGQLRDLQGIPDSDWRKSHNPRFQGEAFTKVRMGGTGLDLLHTFCDFFVMHAQVNMLQHVALIVWRACEREMPASSSEECSMLIISSVECSMLIISSAIACTEPAAGGQRGGAGQEEGLHLGPAGARLGTLASLGVFSHVLAELKSLPAHVPPLMLQLLPAHTSCAFIKTETLGLSAGDGAGRRRDPDPGHEARELRDGEPWRAGRSPDARGDARAGGCGAPRRGAAGPHHMLALILACMLAGHCTRESCSAAQHFALRIVREACKTSDLLWRTCVGNPPAARTVFGAPAMRGMLLCMPSLSTSDLQSGGLQGMWHCRSADGGGSRPC